MLRASLNDHHFGGCSPKPPVNDRLYNHIGEFWMFNDFFFEKNIIQKYRNLVLLEDVFSDKTTKIICSYMFLLQKKMPAIPRVYIYGIFTYIYHRNQLTVGKYTIHGSYGIHFWQHYHYQSTSFNTPSPNLPPLLPNKKNQPPAHYTKHPQPVLSLYWWIVIYLQRCYIRKV